MPKLKSNRGAAKRFRKTATGYKCRSATRRHILTKRSAKNKRQLRAGLRISDSDKASIDQMLPFA